MKYTKEERLKIGKRLYNGEISRYEAAEEYGIAENSARNYMRLYRDSNGLPAKKRHVSSREKDYQPLQDVPDANLEAYKSMTKEQLIQELVMAGIREARLKKGYEVKGDGPQKVFILLGNQSTK